ncbi:type II toxin-antitoxin system YoeB family toxin [Tissierella sp. P1]|uniref:type II toxin-antitoxin system YoeB family toxin n=1 Tax=Tissierella sp. P1 TaxID=1280483 RepID=UPI003516C440
MADFKKNKNNLKGDDLGKPESLKHELTGYRSHRIEMEHRLIIVLIRIMFI